MKTNWLVPVAIIIGFIFVFISNKKTEKKLMENPKEEKEDENIYKNR